MRQFFHWLLTINSPDEEIRRRGRNVIILMLGMITICLFCFLVLPFAPVTATVYIIIIVAMMIYTGVLLLARHGYVTISAIVFLLTISSGLFSSLWSTQLLSVVPFFLVLPLLIAGLSVRPWQIWVVLAGLVVALLVTLLALPNRPLNNADHPADRRAR